jgi:hypothetical protein
MTDSSAERVARHREKQRLAEQDAGEPWEGLIGEVREQAIKDYYGYVASETRTQIERQAAASRIVAKLPPPIILDPAPPRVWVEDPRPIHKR